MESGPKNHVWFRGSNSIMALQLDRLGKAFRNPIKPRLQNSLKLFETTQRWRRTPNREGAITEIRGTITSQRPYLPWLFGPNSIMFVHLDPRHSDEVAGRCPRLHGWLARGSLHETKSCARPWLFKIRGPTWTSKVPKTMAFVPKLCLVSWRFGSI